MKRLGFLLLMAGALIAAPAQAQYLTGNTLKRYCDSDAPLSRGFCTAFVAGAVDATALGVSEGGSALRLCVPRGVELGQLVDVVGRYMASNPDQLHWDAASVTVAAVAVTFPCGGRPASIGGLPR